MQNGLKIFLIIIILILILKIIKKKHNEQLIIYSKKDFENDTMKYFNNKPKKTVNHLIAINNDEKFLEIIFDLLIIQKLTKEKNLILS